MRLEQEIAGLAPSQSLAGYARPGGLLFPQFAAVVAGLRPGMDDWVLADYFESFSRFVEACGLFLEADSAFRRVEETSRSNIVGYNTLNTTHSRGIPVEEARPGDDIHVFIAREKKSLQRLRASGWYPLIVHDRVFHKPYVDYMSFGQELGYPDCCVRFFERSNDWNRTNTYAESVLATLSDPDYRANCFGKSKCFSLIFHMPCRFDCPATIRFSASLEEFLESTEPLYLGRCRQLLKMPVLCANETDTVLLDGYFDGPNRVRYKAFCNLSNTDNRIMEALSLAEVVEIRGRFIVTLRGADIVSCYECRMDRYGPQVPMLLRWT